MVREGFCRGAGWADVDAGDGDLARHGGFVAFRFYVSGLDGGVDEAGDDDTPSGLWLWGWLGEGGLEHGPVGLGSAESGLVRSSSEAGFAGEVLFGTPSAGRSLIASCFGVGTVLAGYGCPPGDGGPASSVEGLDRVSGLVVGGVVSLEEVSVWG